MNERISTGVGWLT